MSIILINQLRSRCALFARTSWHRLTLCFSLVAILLNALVLFFDVTICSWFVVTSGGSGKCYWLDRLWDTCVIQPPVVTAIGMNMLVNAHVHTCAHTHVHTYTHVLIRLPIQCTHAHGNNMPSNILPVIR